MSEAYAREILKRNVAQICQTIGWGGINSMPLDILVHVLEKYMRTLGTQVGRYAEQFERTEPNLNDLGLVFNDLNVQLPEILDYCKSVPPVPAPFEVEKFPKVKDSHLNFLKPGSHEVVTRPVHVHEHLPPMYPEKERDTPLVADTVEILQNGMDPPGSRSPEISVTDSPEKAKDIFKRPSDPVSLNSNKRPRLRLEEEERTREISSVMMTMSGFLSPAREGKLPEAKAPITVSEKHDRHKISSHSNIFRNALHPPLDKKSKKSKLANGKIMKSKRKDKSHKGDSSKSKEGKDKHHPGHSGSKSKDLPLGPQSNFAMPLPKSLPPAPKPIVPPLENLRPIKQEPVEYPTHLPNKNHMTKEDSIPVPKRIPISKSPLTSNSFANKFHPANALHPDISIKKEKLDEEEKLSSQPDRSKVNIFKRISNKANTSEVVQDKSQSSSLYSRLPNTSTDSNNVKVKLENTVVNNNDESAVDYSQVMDLTTNEVISLDDDFDVNIYPNRRHIVEPRPNPLAINKNLQFFPKEQTVVSPKIKKERKHKEKKDKTAEKVAKLEAKLLKKQQQQMSMEMAQAEKQALKLAKKKKSKPKNDPSKQLPPGFPFFPNMPQGRGLPNPGLIPDGDFLAGLANNPALRGLPHPNLLANPFALNAGPGLIPGPVSELISGNVDLTGNQNSLMNSPNLGHSSRTPSEIPTMLRRPSLEVIPVDQDDDRGYNETPLHGDRDRNNKQTPNILKHKKSHKDHKVNLSKMPPVQPDVTIALNPPKPTVIQEQIKPDIVKKIPKPVPIKIPSPEVIRKQEIVPEVNVETIPVQVTNSPDDKDLEKIEKKKDKSHKKEKKDKDGLKIKKKKDKKDKNKDKSDKKKEEKHELKEKLKKERKEKKKAAVQDGLVPKLTLKLGSSSPVPPSSSPDVFKLNIKPIVKKEDDDDDVSLIKDDSESRDGSRSPELAQISALVTRPPKPKHTKHNNVEEPKSPPASGSSPTRKNRPPSGHKFKRILFKTLAKKGQAENFDDDEVDSVVDESVEDKPPQPIADKSTGQLPTPFYVDEQGNKIWVCPACGRQDNGSPMIGCDGCDGWYHWVCVGITEEPGATEDWFCRSCVAKRASMVFAGIPSGKKRGRKSKGDKVRDCN